MARSEKYSTEIKEKAYARYLAGESIGRISKDLKVPESTVRRWIKKKPADKLDGIREEHQKKFIERANRIIDKGMELLEQRFQNALEKEKELLLIIEEIGKSGDEVISDKSKAEVINKLRELLVYDPKTIAVAICTVYDKRAKSEERSEDKAEGGVIFIPEKKKEE